MAKPIGLNLGCGRDYRKGWINVDNKQMYNGDFKVDVEGDFKEFDIKKETVDVILANHIIQYITPTEMDKLLKRWFGWLKDGGSIYIEAGDVLNVCRNILEAKTVEELHGENGIMQLYGIDNNIWNTWAWCPASLTQAMDRAGFKNLFTGPGYFHYNRNRDFITVGYKNPKDTPDVPSLLVY